MEEVIVSVWAVLVAAGYMKYLNNSYCTRTGLRLQAVSQDWNEGTVLQGEGLKEGL